MFNVKYLHVSFSLLLPFVFTATLDAKNYHWENITQQQYINNLIACHQEIKQYEWSKSIWPKTNSTPKPAFENIISTEAIRNEVLNGLNKQRILAQSFNIKITSELLQHDLDRMAKNSKDPQALKEIYKLFSENPVTIAHCISRPYLVMTKLSNSYYWSSEIHNETKLLAQDRLQGYQLQTNNNISQTFQHKTLTYKIKSETAKSSNQEKLEPIVELSSVDYENKILKLKFNQVQENKNSFFYHEIIRQSKDSITLNTLEWKKQNLESWLSRINLNHDYKFPIQTQLSLTQIHANKKFNKTTILADSWESTYKVPGERSGHTGVWTGIEMLVWGGGIGGIELNTGAAYNPLTDSWREMNSSGAPIAREEHTASWTGTEMVIWGGKYLFNGLHYLRSGGRYNPNSDSWTDTSLSNAPSIRADHTAVWDGNKVIIWGGYDGSNYLNTGSQYDPSTDLWQVMTTTSAPTGRESHTAVWTGDEMIIWGGRNLTNLRTGSRYDPNLDQWQAITELDSPIWRYNHTAVWTGEKMIIWGGANASSRYNTGGLYNPSNDSWQSTTTVNAPSGRIRHSAIWTGAEMIIWGGHDPASFNDGGRYNPDTDSWSVMPLNNVPSARSSHSTIWTGAEMIIWGGIVSGSANTGGRYHPDSNTWQTTYTTDAPIARSYHTTIWTGNEMIVWGGENTPYLNDGGRYHPFSDAWSPTSLTNAPSARSEHSAVWTGTEMIVWGGKNNENSGLTYLDSGAKYSPIIDSWQTLSTLSAPNARYNHTGIWTGTEMIVWGGRDPDYSNTGGRYDPDTDTWQTTNSIDAPTGRRRHTAVWSGDEMIVWGGYYSDGGIISLNSGGRYNPVNDSWQETNTTNAPVARFGHSVVWSGTEMIIWAGGPSGPGSMTLTGGRYNPNTNSWVTTSTLNAPSSRKYHSAIWTGSEMIVWGGYYSDGFQDYYKTGGRYDPINNQWQATTLENSPRERIDHTAIWTGTRMIIWGGNTGSSGSTSTNTLGAYYPYDYDDLIFEDGFNL